MSLLSTHLSLPLVGRVVSEASRVGGGLSPVKLLPHPTPSPSATSLPIKGRDKG